MKIVGNDSSTQYFMNFDRSYAHSFLVFRNTGTRKEIETNAKIIISFSCFRKNRCDSHVHGDLFVINERKQ
jgi:hypothetical protein